MAAFEVISKVQIKTLHDEEPQDIDYRTAVLPEELPPEDDFDPRDHRQPKVEIAPWMAYFNLLRTAVGVGLVGMPMAISQAGKILGPLLVVFVASLIITQNISLLRTLNEISRQLRIPNISYRYGFRVAVLHGPPILRGVGESGPTIIAVMMILSQVGICTVLVIFTADNLRDLMDWRNDKLSFISLYIPFVILELYMRNFKKVSYVAMFGNVVCLIGAMLVTVEILREGRFEPVRCYTTNLLEVLVAFGIAVFTFSSVGVIIACDKSLKDPKIMEKVIKVGIAVPATICTTFGVLGYCAFGVMEENGLRYFNYDNVSTSFIFGTYIIIVTTVYPLQCFPGIQVLLDVIKNHDPLVTPSEKFLKIVERIFRPLFVTITFFIAYMVPFQGPFIAFVGNFITIVISIIFPALMELCVLYPDRYGPHNIILIKDSLIIAFGIAAWLMGVALCGYLLYVRVLTYFNLNSDEHSYL